MSVTRASRQNSHNARPLYLTVAAAMLASGGVATLAGPAEATTAPTAPTATTATARPAVGTDTSWVEQAYECTDTGAYLTPQQSSRTGPQRAPFGAGSHRVEINEYTVQTELYRTAEYDGLALAGLSRLEYSTFASPKTTGDADRQPTYLRLNVDTDADTVRDTSLFFIPANNQDQQTLKNGVWQNWNVAAGKLSVDGDSGPTNTVTLADFAAAHPGATLVNNDAGKPTGGALALITGCGMGGDTDSQRNGVYYVDRVIVGQNNEDELYDFGVNEETDGTTTTEVVDPTHFQGWVTQSWDYTTDKDLATRQTFVRGPGNVPAGVGSLRFVISDDTNPNRVEQFRTPEYDGRLLRDIRDLGYAAKQHGVAPNTTPQQPVYLRLNVDTDGDGTRDESLFFFPANNQDQHALAQGEWQSWDAAHGKWNINGDDGPASSVTLEQYVVKHPDATIVNNNGGAPTGGGVTLQAGAGGAGQTNGEYFVDDFVLRTADAATSSSVSGIAYDLEPTIPVPAVSIGNASVTEGNSGTKTVTFPVTLDKPTYKPVDVDWSTTDGTAKSGSDYDAAAGTVTFAADEVSKTVTVIVHGDKAYEAAERFAVNLDAPSFGTLGDGSATGTVRNDDTRVDLSLANAGTRQIRVKVATLPVRSNAPVAVYQRIVNRRDPLLKSATLDRFGRLEVVLSKQFNRGSHVTLYTKVTTANGTYVSRPVTITIK